MLQLQHRQRRSVALGMLVVLATMASCVNGEFRTLNGTGNNLSDSAIGTAGQVMVRVLVPGNSYADGIGNTAAATALQPARQVSNALHSIDGSENLAWQSNSEHRSRLFVAWGQFAMQDMASIALSSNTSQVMSLAVPHGDAAMDPFSTGNETMSVRRSNAGVDINGVRSPINSATAWLDASHIYGTDNATATSVRDPENPGMLRVVSDTQMLPERSTGACPFARAAQPVGASATCGLAAADARGNEDALLAALHVVFSREHNRVAAAYAAATPAASPEQVYQHARRWVGALVAKLTVYDWAPLLLGPDHALDDTYPGYDASVDASIDVFFATVAARAPHSMLPAMLARAGPVESHNRTATAGFAAVPQRQAFWTSEPLDGSGIDEVLRGAAWQVAAELDVWLVDDLRNFLFGLPGPGHSGIDLLALDLARADDHGVPGYNASRVALGLAPVQAWSDVVANASSTVMAAVQAAYPGVQASAAAALVGALAEPHLPGAVVGATLARAISLQLQRVRRGDRLWFENMHHSGFSSDEVQEIRATTLSDVIRRNTDITLAQVPPNLMVSAARAGVSASGSVRLLDARMQLSWRVDQDTLTLELAVGPDAAGNLPSWLGFGFSRGPAPGLMSDADLYMGWVDEVSGTAFLRDMSSDAGSGFRPDVQSDVFDVGGSRSSSVLRLWFSRNVDTGDSAEDVAVIMDPAVGQGVLVAFGPGGVDVDWDNPTAKPPKHLARDRTALVLNLWTGQVEGNPPMVSNVLRILHGAMLSLTWTVMANISAFLARNLRHHKRWFWWHRRLNRAASMISLGMFTTAVAVFRVSPTWSEPHVIVGLILMCLGLLQTITGKLMAQLLDKLMQRARGRPCGDTREDRMRRGRIKKRLRQIHGPLGMLTLTLALANIPLGLLRYGADIGWVMAAMMWGGMVLSFWAAGELLRHSRFWFGPEVRLTDDKHVRGRRYGLGMQAIKEDTSSIRRLSHMTMRRLSTIPLAGGRRASAAYKVDCPDKASSRVYASPPRSPEATPRHLAASASRSTTLRSEAQMSVPGVIETSES